MMYLSFTYLFVCYRTLEDTLLKVVYEGASSPVSTVARFVISLTVTRLILAMVKGNLQLIQPVRIITPGRNRQNYAKSMVANEKLLKHL